MSTFANKVVIITGGASGIGLTTATAFAQQGARVMIADLNQQAGEAAARQLIQADYQAHFFPLDVTNEAANQQLIQATIDHFGQLDIVFANAGIAHDNKGAELDFVNWQKTIDINLSAVFLMNKYAIQYWLKHQLPGVIVNCGSIHSYVGRSGVTAYAAAKGGVKLLTQSLAVDYASKQIRINAVCPGYIETPLIAKLPNDAKTALSNLHPLGRLGTAQEVANVVLFLASPAASFVHGAAILVDGGYTAQ